jgi:hypothetical protein
MARGYSALHSGGRVGGGDLDKLKKSPGGAGTSLGPFSTPTRTGALGCRGDCESAWPDDLEPGACAHLYQIAHFGRGGAGA